MSLSVLLAILLVSGLGITPRPVTVTAQGGDIRTDAVVLVNSTSVCHDDFEHYVQPYLDHFGIPYTVLDISATPVGAEIGEYALIIIGHRQLDVSGGFLSVGEQSYISSAVDAGTGLVNLDNDLSSGGSTPHYQFIQDIFGFTYTLPDSWAGVLFMSLGGGGGTQMHWITERHEAGELISTGYMTMAGITLPAGVTALAMTHDQPFLAVTTHGLGRAVQWGSYDWMSHAVKGPIYGLDDLVWRSLVWAARKPFVMQGMLPFLTMRVDDEVGPFLWIHIANEFGIKPWTGLFYFSVDDEEAADLSALVNAGQATASVHAEAGDFFYYNHGVGDFSDQEMADKFAHATAWHQTHNIPIARFVVPHYYEFGTNVFQGLQDWGVEFVGTQLDPGADYGGPWIMNGPFRKYETGNSESGYPMYYADFMTIPNHPEFDGEFFNCVTEIRDDAGYEWYPDLNDVAGSIDRGTRQTRRALDSMALATLFAHAYFTSVNEGNAANWRAILQGITDNLAPYNVINVTMDEACQYARAMHTSSIAGGRYDPLENQITVDMAGQTDMATMFYLFTEDAGTIRQILVDVPTFSGSAQVVFELPGPLDHIVVTPNPATVAAGAVQQFTATAYDADDNPIPNLPFTWSVVNGGGTINATGLFTAGIVPGTYADTVTASFGTIQGTATVEIIVPPVDHFTFDPISSPKYVGLPFSITLAARDTDGNVVVGYAGQASLSDTTGTISPATTGNFSSGVWSGSVTIALQANGVTLAAVDGSVTGSSNSFDVVAGPTCPCSIWNPGVTVGDQSADGQAVELGVKFRADTDGYIVGMRFYKHVGNTGEHVGSLWSRSGTNLGTVTFSNETASGWQEASFANAIPIQADTTYVASYHTNTGHYAQTQSYFASAGVDTPPLHALRSGVDGSNGVYAYSASSVFPSSSWNDSNYWVDVIFVPAEPTAVTLAFFTAEPGADHITLTWKTATETDALGFHLYRAESPDGLPTRLNDSLIPCQMAGSPLGATYHFVDGSAAPGVTYYYWLEAVHLRGEVVRHGPVAATLIGFRSYLPWVLKD